MTTFDSLPNEKLTVEQEEVLARKIQKNKGDEKSVNTLVLANMREAVIYMRRCSAGLVDDGTLISVCYTAMVLAAKRFKPGRIRFFAFCKVRIRGAVKRNWTTLDVVKRAKSITRGQAIIEREKNKPVHPRDYIDDEENKTMTNIGAQIIMSNEPLSEAEIVQPDMDTVYLRERWAFVKTIIESVCTEREKMILDLVYMQGFNQNEIGCMLEPPICRERVRQLHDSGLRKVRWNLMEKGRLLND